MVLRKQFATWYVRKILSEKDTDKMDGAILVVSAADGGLRQESRGACWQSKRHHDEEREGVDSMNRIRGPP